MYLGISIHAPSRERRSMSTDTDTPLRFQSTLPHGSDYHAFGDYHAKFNFNPRSLTGATPLHGAGCQKSIYFNPRSLTGATTARYFYDIAVKISIHAPSRERLTSSWSAYSIIQFQSTLPHGSDIVSSIIKHAPTPFQSTLPHGSD